MEGDNFHRELTGVNQAIYRNTVVLNVIRNVLLYTRRYNPRSVRDFGDDWFLEGVDLPAPALLFRLRGLLWCCAIRDIGSMYDKHVFDDSWESLKTAIEVVYARGGQSFPEVIRMTREYTDREDNASSEHEWNRMSKKEEEEVDEEERHMSDAAARCELEEEEEEREMIRVSEQVEADDTATVAPPSADEGELIRSTEHAEDTATIAPPSPADSSSSTDDAMEVEFSDDSSERRHAVYALKRGGDVNEGASTSGMQQGGGKRERLANTNADDHIARPPGVRFVIVDERWKYYRRFAVTGSVLTLKIITPPETIDPVTWLEEAIQDIHNYATTSVPESVDDPANDYIGFGLDTPSFTLGTAGLSFRPVRDSRYEDLWRLVFNLTQSASEFRVDDAFTITVNRVSVPVGRGRKSKPLTHEDVSKRSLLEVERDNLCLPRAIISARAYLNREGIDADSAPRWSDVRHAKSRLQREAAVALCREARVEVPAEGCGMLEIVRFQEYLAPLGLAVVIYDFNTFGRGDDPVYNGARVVVERGECVSGRLNILYFPRGGHYKPILNLTAAAANRRFCEPCNIAYRNVGGHRCSNRCTACNTVAQCVSAGVRVRCVACGRWFFGDECLRRHRVAGSFDSRRSVCDTLQMCSGCGLFVNRAKGGHSCGEAYCHTCGSVQPINHECYMQPLKPPTGNQEHIFVFYDFETQQCAPVAGSRDVNLHVPNLCVVQQACTNCIREPDITTPCLSCGLVREFVFRDNPVKQLVEFVTRDVYRFKKIFCIAHNASGFDSQFILRYLVENSRDPPQVILNGTKIVLMETGHTRFLDSLAYMPMPLAALPKAFGLPVESRKGIFPHLFNTPENRDYVGPLPAAEFYTPDSMKTSDREAFYKWYGEATAVGYVFDFNRELVAYCRSDVDILRRACVAYRDIFLNCGGVCPFSRSTTIASACSIVFRQNFLRPRTIGILPTRGYRLANNQSVKALKWLVWMERVLGTEVRHAARGREYRIPETRRLVDGYYTDEEGVRHVLEFHGCYWHGCRRCHTVNRDKELSGGDTMDRRWEETRSKTARMTELRYRVTEMWECAFDEMLEADPEMRDYVDQHPLVVSREPLNPRDAFFGGRTGNTRRYHEAAAGEKIRYVDVCSLYPWVCKTGRYPVGHPRVYVGRECRVLTGPYNNDISGLEGLVKCVILPPRNLYHPVLPVRMRGKLMFPLCRSCCEASLQIDCPHESEADRWFTGTWVSAELQKAVAVGYSVIDVSEIWQYESTVYDPASGQGGLFAPYIDTFLKIKQEASGWPAECTDEASRERYLAEYEQVEGISLQRDKITKNAGLRSVSKLCLNSFWGKFGQRENLPRTEVIKDRQRLLELLTDPENEVVDILPVTEQILYARWINTEESVAPSPLANVVLAAYTTAQARLKLYSYLERLGRRVLYYDTDSVIYVCRSGDWEPATGNFLGDLTDELTEYGDGSYIKAFVSGGPKFYAFLVQKGDGEVAEVCKVKGVTLNYQTQMRINFNSIRDMVVEAAEPIRVERRAIQRTALHRVVTLNVSKICRPVQTKRRLCDTGYDTLPFGYKSSHN